MKKWPPHALKRNLEDKEKEKACGGYVNVNDGGTGAPGHEAALVAGAFENEVQENLGAACSLGRVIAREFEEHGRETRLMTWIGEGISGHGL